MTCGERALGTLSEGPGRGSFVQLLDFTGRCATAFVVTRINFVYSYCDGPIPMRDVGRAYA